jgi:hypothetical protein
MDSSNIINSTEDIRIAYICLCHTDPDFVAHTADTLAYQEDAFFVHVDKKTEIEPFLEKCKSKQNVVFVQDDKRVKTYWGGFNAIIALMNTLEMAVAKGGFDRFVILQGQDYPLVSNREIHDFYRRRRQTEFCKALDISRAGNKHDRMFTRGFWLQDVDKGNPALRLLSLAFSRFNKLGLGYRKAYFKCRDTKWDIYKGWAQLSLTMNCVLHILDVYRNNKAFNRYFKNRFPVDEMYLHTIIYNSDFRDRLYQPVIYNRHGAETLLNMTYFEYPDQVVVFSKSTDYEWLKRTGCLFARKINSSSRELVDVIDRHIRNCD